MAILMYKVFIDKQETGKIFIVRKKGTMARIYIQFSEYAYKKGFKKRLYDQSFLGGLGYTNDQGQVMEIKPA